MQSMKIEELIEEFSSKPYRLRQGAGYLATYFDCTVEDIYEARARVKTNDELGVVDGGKVLIFDLETSPLISYTWGTRKQFIQPDAIIRDWSLMTYAAKWLGEDKIYSGTARDEEDFDDFNIVSEMWSLLDQADVVVAHNLNRFDKKKINARFLAHGMTPPSPYKCVDTLTISKSNFGTTYHRLDYLAKFIGAEGKMEHEGFMLWRKCMEGDKSAWDTMLKYNEKDVTELEEVYLILRPWDSRHPSMGVFKEDPDMCCTKCASKNLSYVKDTYTNTRVYKLYQCQDCKSWSRSRSSEGKVKALMTQ